MELNIPHVLIVDDDKRILELIKNYLNNNNFRVSVALNVQDAREKLENLEFDLLIVDIMMPGENGLEFTKSLKKTNLNNPIILLSALGEVKDRINGLEIGADDYLPKPFEPKELLLRIKNLLKRNNENKTTKKLVKFGPFKFNLKKEILTKENSRVILTPSESKILNILKALLLKDSMGLLKDFVTDDLPERQYISFIFLLFLFSFNPSIREDAI